MSVCLHLEDNVAESTREKVKPVDTEQKRVCGGDEPATTSAAKAPRTRPENRDNWLHATTLRIYQSAA